MKKRRIKPTMIGIIVLVTVVSGIYSTAFADNDIFTLLSNWYNKKVIVAKQSIEEAVQSELISQKFRIEDAMTKEMARAAEDLDSFTEEEIYKHKESIRDYADYLIAGMDFSNEEDKAKVESILSDILYDAQGAMDSLIASYEPPRIIYVPSVIEVPLTEVPEKPSESVEIEPDMEEFEDEETTKDEIIDREEEDKEAIDEEIVIEEPNDTDGEEIIIIVTDDPIIELIEEDEIEIEVLVNQESESRDNELEREAGEMK